LAGLSRAERELLRRLVEIGGKYTFRPDGEAAIARRTFEQGIVATLMSPQEKRLVAVDMHESTRVTLPSQPGHFTSIVVELTEAGRKPFVVDQESGVLHHRRNDKAPAPVEGQALLSWQRPRA
jgi:hypothetical protein